VRGPPLVVPGLVRELPAPPATATMSLGRAAPVRSPAGLRRRV